MEIQKMKQQFTTWNKATSIDTFSGPVLAVSAIGFAENKNLPDLEYYECTYNGEKDEIYFDVYVKLENKVISSNKFKREVKLKNE